MRARSAMAMFAALMIAGGAPAAPDAAPLPTGGTVAIEPKTASGDYDPALQAFAAAASDAFAGRGFTTLSDPDHAALTAELILTRSDVGTGTARAPTGGASATPGALGSAGVGVAIPLATGKSQLVALRRTRLELRLRRRGAPAIVWQGAAVTVRAADAKRGSDAAVAADLARALLAAYPAQPVPEIGIP